MDSDRETKDILREILKWTKFQGMQKVKQVLETTLDSDTKKLIYELSDGRSSSEIARTAMVSAQTVRNYWREWAVLGIAETHPDYARRYHRIFSLMEVGINVPDIAGDETTTKEGESD